MQVRPHFSLARELFAAMPTLSQDLGFEPRGQESSLDYLMHLRASPTPENALAFAAHLLPKREAIWWGCQCVWQVIDVLPPQDQDMLDIATRWIEDPDEPQRRAALSRGMSAAEKSPGAWLVLAVGWSGGSLANPDSPRVPPPPYLTPRAVTVATQMALAKVARKTRGQTLGQFVDNCLDMIVI